MSTILSRIRCGVDISTRTHQFLDELSDNGQAPIVWRASKCQFELGFFFGHGSSREIVTDFTDLASITVGAKSASDMTGAYVITPKTTIVSDISDEITAADWESNDPGKAHIVIEYSDAELNIAPGSYWLEVTALDTTGQNVMLGGTTLTVKESGIGGENLESVAPGLRVPYLLRLGSDGLYYTETLVAGADGKQTIQLSETGVQ